MAGATTWHDEIQPQLLSKNEYTLFNGNTKQPVTLFTNITHGPSPTFLESGTSFPHINICIYKATPVQNVKHKIALKLNYMS